MLDLQDITFEYLEQNFHPGLIAVVLDACTVLQNFNVSNYEHSLVNLITQSQQIEPDDVRDIFIATIYDQLYDLLKEHHITIDHEAEPTVKELTEVGLFLLLLQNLENPEQAAYRVNGYGSPKTILVDLMSVYSTMPRFRAMEIINSVDEKLIWAISAMVNDKLQTVDTDTHQRTQWRKFYSFVNATDCLGVRLHKEGYFGLSLKEVTELSRFSLQEYIYDTVNTRVSQAALDVLSLLYVCRDTYENPLLSFDKSSNELFTDITQASRVRVSIVSIINDFTSWLQAYEQALMFNKEEVV